MRCQSPILAVLALSASFVFAEEPAAKPEPGKKEGVNTGKPKALPKVTIGNDTTFVTGPLREDGTVDFLAAINEHASRGVTPENNAAIPFWKVMGPKGISETLRERYFRKLGIDPLPEEGEYFVDWSKFLNQFAASNSPLAEQLKDKDSEQGQEKWDQILTQYVDCARKPWQADEFPILAAWLAKNDKLLDRLQEAMNRDHFYCPYLGDGEDPVAVVGVLLPAAQQARELARALTDRAMLRLGSGKISEAEDDLLACHRLARHVASGETLIESLVGIAIDGLAQISDRALANSGKLSTDELRAYAAQLRALPPLAPMIERINFSERLMFIDCTLLVAHQGSKVLAEWGADLPASPWIDSALKAGVDWDAVLRRGNSWYDRLVVAGRESDYAKQKADLQQLEMELRKLSKDGGVLKSLAVQGLTKGLKDALTEGVGTVLISFLLPATSSALQAEHRLSVEAELTQFAFALAIFHSEYQQYPAELKALRPKYLDAIPIDRLGGAPFHYSASKDGYLLYSVGRNGQDDGGINDWDEGEKPGDDLVVKVGKVE